VEIIEVLLEAVDVGSPSLGLAVPPLIVRVDGSPLLSEGLSNGLVPAGVLGVPVHEHDMGTGCVRGMPGAGEEPEAVCGGEGPGRREHVGGSERRSRRFLIMKGTPHAGLIIQRARAQFRTTVVSRCVALN
jgi:hypothetical protein